MQELSEIRSDPDAFERFYRLPVDAVQRFVARRALGLAWAQGAVPPCQVVGAPAGSGPLGGPPVSSAPSDQG